MSLSWVEKRAKIREETNAWRAELQEMGAAPPQPYEEWSYKVKKKVATMLLTHWCAAVLAGDEGEFEHRFRVGAPSGADAEAADSDVDAVDVDGAAIAEEEPALADEKPALADEIAQPAIAAVGDHLAAMP